MAVSNQPVARLIWRTEAGEQEHLLKQGDKITIGRGETSTIVVNSPKVSRNHARIEWSGDHFTICDLGSSNGTFVNGNRVEYMPWGLKDGDEISLEQIPFSFEIISIHRVIQDPYSIPTISLAAQSQERKPYLVITGGLNLGNEFVITGELITIGRESQKATWEIRLPDQTISRPHARIEKKGVSYVLIDLGSANGTTLNGLFVIDPVILNDGDVIGMGETTLVFHTH
jgi:pSer/pThr/pTyr-binding forkhead associated (FHA) protein